MLEHIASGARLGVAIIQVRVAHKHFCVARVSYRRNSKMLEHVAGEAELGVAILQIKGRGRNRKTIVGQKCVDSCTKTYQFEHISGQSYKGIQSG